MRFVFIASGFVGFTVVAVAGYSADRAADLVLRDAAWGCVAGAVVGRWFWRVVQNAVAQTAAARRAAAEAAEAEAEAEANKAGKTGKPKPDHRASAGSASPLSPATASTAGSRSPMPAAAGAR